MLSPTGTTLKIGTPDGRYTFQGDPTPALSRSSVGHANPGKRPGCLVVAGLFHPRAYAQVIVAGRGEL
jgi:hypothetical protein